MFRWMPFALLAALFLMPHAAHAQLIVAHRGASHEAPENTLAAFKLAWEQGADAIEGDYHLTRDGKIVCIHDADTKRVTGIDKKIDATDFDVLRAMDVGSWKGTQFAKERMPTLEEVLAIVPEGRKVFIEIKCGPSIVPPLKQQMEASRLKPEQMVIISFSAEVIAAARRQMPDIKAHWLTSYKQDKEGKTWMPSPQQVMATLKRIGASGLDTNAHESIDEVFVKSLRAEKLEFHCWTVDDPKLARRFISLGVDSITTNRPGWLRDQLK